MGIPQVRALLAGLEFRWQRMGRHHRIALGCGILALFSCLVAMALFRGEDDFCSIRTEDVGRIFDLSKELDRAGIVHRVAGGGKRLEVCRNQLPAAMAVVMKHRAKLAAENDSSSAMFSGTFFTPPSARRKAELRRREKELACTIAMYEGVESAKVLISRPDDRLFSGKKKEARAAVFLQLERRGVLSSCQVAAIRDLVANGVEGLRRDNVTITDSAGTDYDELLSRREARLKKEELALQERIERGLAKKLQEHLEVMFGPGNVDVAVSVRVDGRALRLYRPRTDSYVRTAVRDCSIRRRGGGKVRVRLVALSGLRSAAPGPPGAAPRSGPRPGEGRLPSILDAVAGICVAVFIDRNLFADGRCPDDLQRALLANVRTVARIDESRGDSVSIQVVPFRKSVRRMLTPGLVADACPARAAGGTPPSLSNRDGSRPPMSAVSTVCSVHSPDRAGSTNQDGDVRTGEDGSPAGGVNGFALSVRGRPCGGSSVRTVSSLQPSSPHAPSCTGPVGSGQRREHATTDRETMAGTVIRGLSAALCLALAFLLIARLTSRGRRSAVATASPGTLSMGTAVPGSGLPWRLRHLQCHGDLQVEAGGDSDWLDDTSVCDEDVRWREDDWNISFIRTAAAKDPELIARIVESLRLKNTE